MQVAERLVEKIEVHDVDEVKEFHVTQLIPEIQVSAFVCVINFFLVCHRQVF